LYFCRDPTLRLFHRFFIISAQLYLPPLPLEIVPPLIVPHHPYAVPLLSIKTPYYGLPLSSRILWDPVLFFKGRWSLNAPALTMSFRSRDSFLLCFPESSPFPWHRSRVSIIHLSHGRLTLASEFRESTTLCVYFFSSRSSFDLCPRYCPLNTSGVHTHVRTVLFLPYRSTLFQDRLV
jgi:hypothetical protein